MKKDIIRKPVEDISIAIILEAETPEAKVWNVYLINNKAQTLEAVMVSSRGYGLKDNVEVQTSTLRHSLGNIAPKQFVAIEAIDPGILGLTNEYLLSYFIDGEIYDKKFIFLPESVIESNLIRTPVLNKPGVVIG